MRNGISAITADLTRHISKTDPTHGQRLSRLKTSKSVAVELGKRQPWELAGAIGLGRALTEWRTGPIGKAMAEAAARGKSISAAQAVKIVLLAATAAVDVQGSLVGVSVEGRAG